MTGYWILDAVMVYISLVTSLQQHQVANLVSTYTWSKIPTYLVLWSVQPLFTVQRCPIEVIMTSKRFDVGAFEHWTFLLCERERHVEWVLQSSSIRL